jgi:L-alanine-DL-glutamate epimerase-like enolase superfamily enzyme
MDRRGFFSMIGIGATAAATTNAVAQQPATNFRDAPANTVLRPLVGGVKPLKITGVEIIEVSGPIEVEDRGGGDDGGPWISLRLVYQEFTQSDYAPAPKGGKRSFNYTARYLRIATESGVEGLYGPIDRETVPVITNYLKPFILGKDALAGETLWDQMYRSNRHSREGWYMMGISAIDNALWDLRARYFGVPVYRLAGGPSRSEIDYYCSAGSTTANPETLKRQCLEFKAMGFKAQKWFIGYGPSAGAEGMRKNVEAARILRETLGDDYGIMFDAVTGWDANYANEWARRVEQYRPRWVEELTHPEKLAGFTRVSRNTTIPLATGEHLYGRWEVERNLQSGALSVIQADPEWCGGVTETIKIGTVASLHDVQVIPHGHSSLRAAAHIILSQSPMTFPMGEFLYASMTVMYQLEIDPPDAHVLSGKGSMKAPTKPGFGIQLDDSKIAKRQVIQ